MTIATIGSNKYEYIYDTAGNILSVEKNDVQTGKYEYGQSDWADLLMKYNDNNFVYDDMGNPTTSRADITIPKSADSSMPTSSPVPVRIHLEMSGKLQR